MPPEAWDGFDAQVRALYEQMTAITITPEWAKLLDFETTAPSAVENSPANETQHASEPDQARPVSRRRRGRGWLGTALILAGDQEARRRAVPDSRPRR